MKFLKSYKKRYCVGIILLVALGFFLFGSCNFGTPILSSYEADPGQFITIYHSTIRPDEPVIVTFSGSGDYVVSSEISDTSFGSMRTTVPVFIDAATGSCAAGEVTVAINGIESANTLKINKPFDLGLSGGIVYSTMLQETVEQYGSVLEKLRELAGELDIDATDIIAEINARIESYADIIAQISEDGTAAIETGSGTETLTGEQLELLDQLLFRTIYGVAAEMQETNSPQQASGMLLKQNSGASFFDDWNKKNPDEKADAIKKSIEYIISETERGVEGGKLWIGGIGIGGALAGALVGGPAGAGIGGAAGIAIGYFSSGYDLGTAVALDKIYRALDENRRDAFDLGENLLEQLTKLGISLTSGFSNLSSELIKKITAILSMASNGESMSEALEKAKCEPEGSQRTRDTVCAEQEYTVSDFCEDYMESSTTTTANEPGGDGGNLNTVESIYENMVSIPGGSFQMGCSDGDSDCDENELPQHEVTISSFKISAYEVTKGQWEAVMGQKPSNFTARGDDCPVEDAVWNDVQDFIEKLNGLTGKSYRLPTEAEWEYAARAGTTTKYYCGDDESCLDDIAWYDDNSGDTIHPVGQKAPNTWGLYDMSGNVFEWVKDCYHETYDGAPTDGSAWETDCTDVGYGSARVYRGGSFGHSAKCCRSVFRCYHYPSSEYCYMGFRLALSQ